MFICQSCGETAKLKWKSNQDPNSKFFMWPSHTNERGLNIYAIFCFSCGTMNHGASKLFSRNFEYFNDYKPSPLQLKRWCLEHNVPEYIVTKLEDSAYY
jgi:hypothetical protein